VSVSCRLARKAPDQQHRTGKGSERGGSATPVKRGTRIAYLILQARQVADNKVKFIGPPRSAYAFAIRDLLQRFGVPFEWIDEKDRENVRTQAQVTDLNEKQLPICVFPDGTRIEHPTIRQIIEKLLGNKELD
jgi:hypothetical protein